MKKYYRGWITLPMEHYLPATTEKAIALTVDGGYTKANDTIAWFPKSQIIVGEANEVGNAEVLIPAWLFRQKSINPSRIRELDLLEIVER